MATDNEDNNAEDAAVVVVGEVVVAPAPIQDQTIGTKKPPHSMGDTSDMNSRVFQCRSETTSPKQLSVTLESLTHYTGNTFKSAVDINLIFKRFTTPHINKLVKLESTDAVDIAIFNEDVK